MSDLVKSISIENLLRQRDAAIERIRQVHGLLVESEKILESARLVGGEISMRSFDSLVGTTRRGGSAVTFLKAEDVDHAVRQIDAAAWDLLMRESGLFSHMDREARQDWSRKIYDGEIPELTRENIAATFSTLHASRGDLFERGVINCFRKLSWDFKTNLPSKFGKRVIVHVRSHGSCSNLDGLEDLHRVFTKLDGAIEEDHRNTFSTRLRETERGGCYSDRAFQHDDTYMRVHVFKNGRGHVTFKRPDLVLKMNEILAKHHPHALPPPRR